jgi:PAS domain S-box-containing protein
MNWVQRFPLRFLLIPALVVLMTTISITVTAAVFHDLAWLILIGNAVFVTGVCLVVSCAVCFERKRTEEALRSAREDWEQTFNSVPDLVATLDHQHLIVRANRALAERLGVAPEQCIGMPCYQVVHGMDQPPSFCPHAQSCRDCREHTAEVYEPRLGGHFLVTTTPRFDEHGRVIGAVHVARDISHFKRAESLLRTRLRLSELARNRSMDELLRTALDEAEHHTASSIGYFHFVDEDQENLLLQAWSTNTLEQMCQAKGKGRHYAISEAGVWVDCFHARTPVIHNDYASLSHKKGLPEGHVRLVRDLGVPVLRGDRVVAIMGVGNKLTDYTPDDVNILQELASVTIDLVAYTRAEEELQTSLHEKAVLLKEIHHRVKNNIQVISSLVSLQADGMQDPALRGMLQDLRDRVRSMALVHEKLYQSESLARVEFAEYARSLLNYLWRAHGDMAAHVHLHLDLQPLLVSVEAAVPCGLILNELAGNALKHAFPPQDREGKKDEDRGDPEPCTVRVTLGTAPDGRVALRVRDNGTGLPAGFDWQQTRSLGMRLVQMLTEQLGGTVEIQNHEGRGTEYEVLFNAVRT